MRKYRCRVCRGVFEHPNMKGRKPVACPEHRTESRRRVDRRKKRDNYARGGPVARPECCAGGQCPQHRQWKSFKKHWVRYTRHEALDYTSVVLTEMFYGPDGERRDNGFHIVNRP